VYGRLVDHAVSRVDRVVSFSASAADRLSRVHRHVEAFPTWFDSALFHPGAASGRTRKAILWVGRLEEEKDPFQLIEIAERLLATDPTWHFVMVGHADDEAYERGKVPGASGSDTPHREVKPGTRSTLEDASPPHARLLGLCAEEMFF
jgi:glycosyltransferase involved in cell wall biosynthesis